MTVHRTLLACCLALALTMLCPTITFATTDLPIYGGLGGEQFRAECTKGFYLVGLAGRTGSWVNSIAPICAPWLRGSQTFGAPVVGPSFGASGGGQTIQANCWGSGPNNSVVQSWHIETLKSDNRFVQYIGVVCHSLKPSPVLTSSPFFEFGPRPAGDELLTPGPYISNRAHSETCPTSPNREIAVGIHGRAGLFVDAVGLICGPIPAGPGTPFTKLPPPLTQAPSTATPMKPVTKNMMIPDDVFVITRPVPGDRLSQGQLVITAIAPKVGRTNVTELELKYLDAPPNQADSYPYTTVFSIDTAMLLQGYPVAPIVTGSNGRWQVRARSSMKAVPGPWSVPVQFQLIATQATQSQKQAPSPMQQVPLPGSSIMQAPLQGVGVAPSVVRPPTTSSDGAGNRLMIRPRGTKEKEKKITDTTPDNAQNP